MRHGAPELRIKLVRDFLWAEIIGTPTVLRRNQEQNCGQKHEEKETASPPPTSSSPQGVRTRVQGRADWVTCIVTDLTPLTWDEMHTQWQPIEYFLCAKVRAKFTTCSTSVLIVAHDKASIINPR